MQAKRENINFSGLQFYTNSNTTEKTAPNVDKFREVFAPSTSASSSTEPASKLSGTSSGTVTEVFDSDASLREKCRYLAECVRDSNHMVAYTGAGISTSCNIPECVQTHGFCDFHFAPWRNIFREH